MTNFKQTSKLSVSNRLTPMYEALLLDYEKQFLSQDYEVLRLAGEVSPLLSGSSDSNGDSSTPVLRSLAPCSSSVGGANPASDTILSSIHDIPDAAFGGEGGASKELAVPVGEFDLPLMKRRKVSVEIPPPSEER